jgi:hypothetical protein
MTQMVEAKMRVDNTVMEAPKVEPAPKAKAKPAAKPAEKGK